MIRTPKLWPVAACVFLVACTSETDLGDRSNPSSSGGETANGIIAGKPFTPTSAYAAFDTVHECTGTGQAMTCVDRHDTLSLTFSSEVDACDAAKSKRLAPGATFVGVHGIPASLGTHTSTDAKFAIVDPNCVSGAPLGTSAAADQGSSRATIQITRIDATLVEGTIVSMTLDDGSTFKGSFSLALCPTDLKEVVCR
jgi:hypothetical protein